MQLDAFEALVRARRSTRRFRPDTVPALLLDRLLDAARWSPSGYNLQPTQVVVVSGRERREALAAACMGQRQVSEAPTVAVFCGDRDVYRRNLERVLAMELAGGSMSPEYAGRLRELVPLAFAQGPLGLGWLWKATLAPLMAWWRPMPSIPAVHKTYWLTKQVMLSAMTFMLAAQAAGLATVPMEGFDAWRVRRVLGIPRRQLVVLAVCVGYSADGELRKTRLPLEDMVHRERW
jgi:nitroreductase